MTTFVATFIALCVTMAAMAIGILLGRSRELKRGCGRECECLNRPTPREECQR